MGRSTKRLLVLVAGLTLEGCVTGHLIDYAREIERPVAYRAATLDGDKLELAYDTVVINERGRRLARRQRRAAVTLADLRRSPPVDAFPVTRLPDGAPLAGQPVALDGATTPALAIARGDDDRETSFVLRAGHETLPPFQSSALSQKHVAPWVYALVPLTLVVDAVSNPVLMFFAPAVMVIGD